MDCGGRFQRRQTPIYHGTNQSAALLNTAPLAEHIRYFSAIRASDSQGVSITAISNGFSFNVQPPALTLCIGYPGCSAFLLSAQQLTGQWSNVTSSSSGVASLQVGFGSAPYRTDLIALRAVNVTAGGLTLTLGVNVTNTTLNTTSAFNNSLYSPLVLTSGQTVYMTAVITDRMGLTSTATSQGATLDLTPPLIASVDDGSVLGVQVNASANSHQLLGRLLGVMDPESGIASISFCIGRNASDALSGNATLLPCTSYGLTSLLNVSINASTWTSTEMQQGWATAVIAAIITNGAGLQTVAHSAGILLEWTPPTWAANSSVVFLSPSQYLSSLSTTNATNASSVTTALQPISWQSLTRTAVIAYNAFPSDAQSGIASIWATLGSQPGLSDILPSTQIFYSSTPVTSNQSSSLVSAYSSIIQLMPSSLLPSNLTVNATQTNSTSNSTFPTPLTTNVTSVYCQLTAINGAGLTANLSSAVPLFIDLTPPEPLWLQIVNLPSTEVQDAFSFATATTPSVLIPIVYVALTSSLSLQWAFRDNQSAIASYSLSLVRVLDDSLSPVNVGVSGRLSVVRQYGSVGLQTSLLVGLVDLTIGPQYRFCVQAFNGAGLSSSQCTPSVVVDQSPPSLGTVSNGLQVGQPLAWYSPVMPLQVSLQGFSDSQSAIESFVWCVGSSVVVVDDILSCVSIGLNLTASSTAASSYFAQLALNSTSAVSQAPFYHTIRAYNAAGLYVTATSAPVMVDWVTLQVTGLSLLVPTTGVPQTQCGNGPTAFLSQPDGNTLVVQWSALTIPQSGVSSLLLGVATAQDLLNSSASVVPFMALAPATVSYSFAQLALPQASSPVFVVLKAISGAAVTAAMVSPGVVFWSSPPSLGSVEVLLVGAANTTLTGSLLFASASPTFGSLAPIIYLPLMSDTVVQAQWTFSAGQGCPVSQQWTLTDLTTGVVLVSAQSAAVGLSPVDGSTVGLLSLDRLTLIAGDLHEFCATMVASSGLSSSTCSLPFVMDATAPSATPLWLSAQQDSGGSPVTSLWLPDWSSFAVSFGSWTDPESLVAAYRYCMGTTPGACDVVAEVDRGLDRSWTADLSRGFVGGQWSNAPLSFNETDTQPFFVSVMGVNGAGLTRTVTSSAMQVDVMPIPVTGLRVTSGLTVAGVNVQYLNDSSSVSAAWNAVQAISGRSGVQLLEVAVSSDGIHDNVVAFAPLSTTATRFTFAQVSLPTTQLLYVVLRVTSMAGVQSVQSSGAFLVELSFPIPPVAVDVLSSAELLNSTGANNSLGLVPTSAVSYQTSTTNAAALIVSPCSNARSGVVQMQWQLMEHDTDAVIAPFTLVPLNQSYLQMANLTLLNGRRYYSIIGCYSGAGWYAQSRTSGFQILSTKPQAGTVAIGGSLLSSSAFVPSLDVLQVTWGAFADGVTIIQSYAVCLGTSAGAHDLLPCQTVGLQSSTVLNLTALAANFSAATSTVVCVNTSTPTGPMYSRFNVSLQGYYNVTVCTSSPVYLFATVIASDPAGNSISSTSPSFLLDSTPPLPGSVSNGFDLDDPTVVHTAGYSARRGAVEAVWGGFSDAESGIASYSLSVSSLVTGKVLSPSINVGLQTSVVLSIPAVQNGDSLVLQVLATNGAGLSTFLSSNVLLDSSPPISQFVLVEDLSDPSSTGGDVDWQNSASAVYASWSNFYPSIAPLGYYEVALIQRVDQSLQVNQLGCSTVAWLSALNGSVGDPALPPNTVWVQQFSNVGLVTSYAFTSLQLCYGGVYSTLVRAVSLSGVRSTAVSSDGVMVNPTLGCLLTVSDQSAYISSTNATFMSWSAVVDPLSDDQSISSYCLTTSSDLYTSTVNATSNFTNLNPNATSSTVTSSVVLLSDPLSYLLLSVEQYGASITGLTPGNFSRNITLIDNSTQFNWTAPTFAVLGNVNATGSLNLTAASNATSNGTQSSLNGDQGLGPAWEGVWTHGVNVSSPFSPCCSMYAINSRVVSSASAAKVTTSPQAEADLVLGAFASNGVLSTSGGVAAPGTVGVGSWVLSAGNGLVLSVDAVNSRVTLLFTQLSALDLRHPSISLPLCESNVSIACAGPIIATAASSSVVALLTPGNVQLWDVREASYNWIADDIMCGQCASLTCDVTLSVCYDPFRPLVSVLPPVNYSTQCSPSDIQQQPANRSALALSSTLLTTVCTPRASGVPALTLYSINATLTGNSTSRISPKHISAYQASTPIVIASKLSAPGLSLANAAGSLSMSINNRVLAISLVSGNGTGAVWLSVVDAVLGLNVYQLPTAAPGGDAVLLRSPAGASATNGFGSTVVVTGSFLLVAAPGAVQSQGAGLIYAYALPPLYNSSSWATFKAAVTTSASLSPFCQVKGGGFTSSSSFTFTAEVSYDGSHVVGALTQFNSSSVQLFVVNATSPYAQLTDPLQPLTLYAPRPAMPSAVSCMWLDAIRSQSPPTQVSLRHELLVWVDVDGSLHESAYCYYGHFRQPAGTTLPHSHSVRSLHGRHRRGGDWRWRAVLPVHVVQQQDLCGWWSHQLLCGADGSQPHLWLALSDECPRSDGGRCGHCPHQRRLPRRHLPTSAAGHCIRRPLLRSCSQHHSNPGGGLRQWYPIPRQLHSTAGGCGQRLSRGLCHLPA